MESVRDAGSDVAHTTRDAAVDVAHTTRDAAVDVARTAKQEARQLAHTTADEVQEVGRGVRQRLRDEVDRQHRQVTDRVGAFAEELYTMARERPETPAGELVGILAARSRTFAEYLDQHGPERVLHELRDFARRRPGTFIVSATDSSISGEGSVGIRGSGGTYDDFIANAVNGPADLTPGNNQTLATTSLTCPRTPQCRDGIDNDGDGAIDLADFSCQGNPNKDDETTPKAEFMKYSPRGRKIAIAYLRGQTFEFVSAADKYEEVRKELGARFQKAIEPARVGRVLIVDYVAQ